MPAKTAQSGTQKIPKLRFSGFSDGWERRTIKNLTHIYDGTHQTPSYVKEGIPFYSVEHVTANDFSDTKFITSDVFNRENKKVKLEKNDILMTRIGDIGTARLIDWDVRASFYVSLVLLKHSEKIKSGFLSQYINSIYFQKELWKRTIHVAFPKKINLGEIGECKLTIPSLSEQQKIANFLSSVDEWIENLRAQKESLESYKKGMMQKIFAREIRFKDDKGKNFPRWEEKKLGEVSEITTGSSNREDSTVKGDYTFFDRSEDIRASSQYLFDTEAVIVAGEGQEFRPKYFVGKFDLHQRTYAIMNFKNTIGKFIFYYIHHNRKYFNKVAVGSTVSSLRLPMFNKMPILLPDICEQQKISDFLTSIDNLIESKQQQITQAEQWKKGLMQGLFV